MLENYESPVPLDRMLFTMVDPHRGHEVAYNRWYERDHFYAGCMIGPGWFAGQRWAAPRRLKDLRFPAERPGRRSRRRGVPPLHLLDDRRRPGSHLGDPAGSVALRQRPRVRRAHPRAFRDLPVPRHCAPRPRRCAGRARVRPSLPGAGRGRRRARRGHDSRRAARVARCRRRGVVRARRARRHGRELRRARHRSGPGARRAATVTSIGRVGRARCTRATWRCEHRLDGWQRRAHRAARVHRGRPKTRGTRSARTPLRSSRRAAAR